MVWVCPAGPPEALVVVHIHACSSDLGLCSDRDGNYKKQRDAEETHIPSHLLFLSATCPFISPLGLEAGLLLCSTRDGKSCAAGWRKPSLLQTFEKVFLGAFLGKTKNNPCLGHHIWPSLIATQPAKRISTCQSWETWNCTACWGCPHAVGSQAVVGGKVCSSPPPRSPNPPSSLLKPHVHINRDLSA